MKPFISLMSLLLPALTLWLLDAFISLKGRGRIYRFAGNRYVDFTILVPIYGNIKYLENVDYLAHYRWQVMLCTTIRESAEFKKQIERIARQHDFRLFFSNCASVKDRTKRATSGTIRDRIIRDALDFVNTKYTVTLDADSVTREDFSLAVGEIETLGADLASIRIVPSNGDQNILTKLQKLEYRLAMNLRHVMPWLVSGACQIAKTAVLRDIMNRHSLFFQGNDVEIGLIGKHRHYRVIHIPFEIYTAVPDKFKPWFRQRLAWSGGEFRLFIVNFRFILRHPFFWFYGGLVVIVAFPLRYIGIASHNLPLALTLVLYILMVIVIHWHYRNIWLLIMPFYTLALSLLLVPMGIFWYFYMAFKDKNLGIIRTKRRYRVA